MGQIERNCGKMRISNQDKKDVDKYTRFLAYKYTQIIIEARSNQKISTSCLPAHVPNLRNTENVFSLHTTENLDVQEVTRGVLGGDRISENNPLTVEILLQTAEGDRMVLEYWCLNLLPDQFDPTVKINHTTVYNRMGILLKSLVSVTRVTPAYKLSRRQASESFLLMYQIFTGEPPLHTLGEEPKNVRIGQICTPIGTIQLNVSYRTKMTISPTHTEKNNSILMKSDHFNANSNTRRHKNNEDVTDLTKPMRMGPFASPKPKLITPVSPASDLPEITPDVTKILSMGVNKTRQKQNIDSETGKSPTSDDESKDQLKGPETIEEETDGETEKKGEEEYWMQELNAPFATLGPVGELMQFYRQCSKSPPLQSPQKILTEHEVKSILEQCESQLPEYEAVVQSFCESPDDN